jgi:hypothetical protein
MCCNSPGAELLPEASRECPVSDALAAMLQHGMGSQLCVLFPGFGRCGRTSHRFGRHGNWRDDGGHCGREQYIPQHDRFPRFDTPLAR